MSEIWVLVDLRGGEPTRASLQLIGAARELAELRELSAVAVLIGGNETVAKALSGIAPVVIHVTGDELEPYEATRHLQSLWQLQGKRGLPVAVLAPASSRGFELTPRLAARFKVGFAGASVALSWGDKGLIARRPLLGGRAYEEVELLMKPAVVTVRSGVFATPEALAEAGQIVSVQAQIDPTGAPTIVDRQATGTGGGVLTEAVAVVAGGRGLGDASNFRIIEELARSLDAAVGASRSVVDAGWRPHDEQIGKSGQTVSPDLYIAVGVSGAIHHVLGMNTSKTVVAINKDPSAPIFENADLGIVGDALEILPALTAAIAK